MSELREVEGMLWGGGVGVLVAQVLAGGNVAYWVRAAIIVAAVLAIGAIAIRGMGLQIPAWVIQMFWVVVIAVVALLAIGVILQLL